METYESELEYLQMRYYIVRNLSQKEFRRYKKQLEKKYNIIKRRTK